MAKQKNTTELVLGKLGKKGKTAAQIAEQLGAKSTTVGSVLSSLVKDGQAQIVGTKKAEGVGRPANLYALAA